MHAALWTLMVVVSAGQPVPAAADNANVPPAYPNEVGYDQGCAGGTAAGGIQHRCWLADWFGSMPQTCYDPHFGCYPGAPRTIHRYPAFHGYYYRDPYNYRMLFQYPWHAAPHEPVGYFTYQAEQPIGEEIVPTPDASITPQSATNPFSAPVPAGYDSQTRVPGEGMGSLNR